MAFAVVMHLSPDHKSNLASVVQNHISIPVSEITETVHIEPNHVYVIPPFSYLVMEDGIIRLTKPERPHGAHTSIDLLFRTLAEAHGKHAIAILMSGTGSDGTLGLGRIKEEGGFTIAQDPQEAEYRDMPRNAIQAGLVDIVLPAGKIADKLLALRDSAERFGFPIEAEEEETSPRELDEGALREILTLVRLRTGNEFQQYKRPTLLRRIARRMQVHDLSDLSDYLNFLHEHPEEINALMRDLLISVTSFFRDRDSFEYLQLEIIPQLFAGKGPNDQVRVWSAGCATGEEAYSLGMLLSEYAATLKNPPRIQVFATDIDDRAIADARECRYPSTISLDVSAERLREFFVADGDRYQLKKEVRDKVLFAAHNVLRDPPFSKVDLISCRNLLIYLNREMQERTLEIFHFALRAEGYLFLGASESAEIVPALFTQIDPKRRVYRRRVAIGQQGIPPNLGKWQVKPPPFPSASSGNPVSAGRLHEEIVEQFAAPSVLINEDYDLVHMSAHAGRYLRVSGGEPTRNLLKLVHPDLRLDLGAALLEARNHADSAPPESRRVAFDLDGHRHSVNLSVRVVAGGPEAARGFLLVIFDEAVETGALSPQPIPSSPGGLAIARQLEQELQRTREQLRITIEQYETSTEELRASNEELQAINEELRSATEELESSKEELQSVNEELTTVNQEYKDKIEELGRTNSDLQNLMAATEIGTIFLDRTLRIKLYTPPAQRIFNITPADVGRPLEHFSHRLDRTSIIEDAGAVLRTLQPLEREVRSSEGNYYVARLAPYRTLDDKIDGIVLTFVDITSRKLNEEQLERQTETLREQAQILALAHVFIFDADRRITLWNAGCERLYGYTATEALGKNAHQLLKTEFSQPRAEIDAQLQKTAEWQGDLVHTTRDGTRINVASHWILHRRTPDGPAVILEVNNDITARRIAEDALRESDQNKDRFLITLGHELRNPLSAMLSSAMLLRRVEAGSEPAKRAREIIERQLNHLMRLVDDLVDVERLSHGRITLKKSRIELSAVINAAIETVRPALDAKGHQLKITLPPEPIVLNADLTRLAQVLSNLLHNASKYSSPGGSLELSAEPIGGEVVIRVRDAGMGIDPEMLPKLFDVYAQGQPLPGVELQGFGIGLALVRQLTEMHGGRVSAHSAGLGKGSEFEVRLPIATNLASQTVSLSSNSGTPGNDRPGRRILIAEDNPDAREAMTSLLQSYGHEVRSAADGTGALEIAAQFKPQVAILDIGLPGLNGYEIARQLHQATPEVVLIALSGWQVEPNDKRTKEAGFKYYFTKPLDRDSLDKLLSEI
jgi:two-component system CheB/CheR fusion protein